MIGALLPLALAAPFAARGEIRVLRHEPEAATLAWWRSLCEERPALRGFRAPLDPAAATGSVVAGERTPREAARIVAARLAPDGLLRTTALALETLGRARAGGAGALEDLRAAGLPVDLLDWFALEGVPEGAAGIVTAIAARLEAEGSAEALAPWLAGATFTPRPSVPGFALLSESGELPVRRVRMQLSSGTYWQAEGDGSCVDLARQLLAAAPSAAFVASIESRHLDAFLALASGWPAREGDLVLVAEELPVAQWAQDNAKAGVVAGADGAADRLVHLAPRYASRGEDGAVLVPGENLLLRGLGAADLEVRQSPLLFQGGDLIAVRHPASGERLLLAGEANLWRNRTLGLTAEQVLAAFRVELGVDRCIVLPAVSFHIDQEVTVRAVGERLVAFVNDTPEAARLVLGCAAEALLEMGALDASAAGEARARAEARDLPGLVEVLVAPLLGRALRPGAFPESFAEGFARGAGDSGVANLQRVLLALDLVTSWTAPLDEPGVEAHTRAYLLALRRLEAERTAVALELERLGFEMARVPGLGEGERGINYLNGIHEPGRYWMPAWGGLFEPVDRAASAALRRGMGEGIEVQPILCSESQRRGGGIHCSVSVAGL